MGKLEIAPVTFSADISRILKYAPAQLIGREGELKLLKDAWAKVQNQEKGRSHILTFVALGGEGKTALVAKWAAELAAQDWPGCDPTFAWSFYSQGTREQQAASSDLFLKEAMNFFASGTKEEIEEIKAFAASPAGAYKKGQKLARIIGSRHCLLILDGLEPLQYAPTAPTPGELKDQGVAALLKGLAAASHGLCIVTTRYSLPDLKAFWQSTAPEVKLLRLSGDAGVHLLKTLGVTGTAQEFATLIRAKALEQSETARQADVSLSKQNTTDLEDISKPEPSVRSESAEDEEMKIQSGTLKAGHHDPQWQLLKGKGERSYEQRVDFQEPFRGPPTVAVSLSGLDVSKIANLRARVEAKDVDRNGFYIYLETWSDSEVYALWVQWMAFGN